MYMAGQAATGLQIQPDQRFKNLILFVFGCGIEFSQRRDLGASLLIEAFVVVQVFDRQSARQRVR